MKLGVSICVSYQVLEPYLTWSGVSDIMYCVLDAYSSLLGASYLRSLMYFHWIFCAQNQQVSVTGTYMCIL